MDNNSAETPTPNAKGAPQPLQYNSQPQPIHQPAYPTAAVAQTTRPNQGSLAALILSLVALTGVVVFLITRSQGTNNGAMYDPELQALRTQVTERRLALGLSANPDASAQVTAESLTNRISNDAGSLSSLMREITDRLSAKDRVIAQKNDEIDNAARARESLTTEIATLTKKLQELRLNSSQASALKLQLEDTKLLLDAANKEIARLREALNGAPSQDSLESSRALLAELEAERDRLIAKLNSLPDENDLSALRKENRRLSVELQELRSETSRNRLFVENSDSLSLNAQALYNQLVSLEGHSSKERLQAYEQIKSELNAKVVETVSFSTGSSAVEFERVGVIKDSLEETPNNAEYLVVGYASKTGNVDTNREISSKRATTVATIADLERGASQDVKAVFLGQTDRFSKLNDYSNQICEIWEILPN